MISLIVLRRCLKAPVHSRHYVRSLGRPGSLVHVAGFHCKYTYTTHYVLTQSNTINKAVGGLDADLIQHLPPSLRIVVSCAVGYDSYDGAALAHRNIILCNSPGLAAAPVADHVLYQTLSLYRYYHVFENLTRELKSTSLARGVPATGAWDCEAGRPVLNTETPPAFSFGQYVGGRAVRQPRGHTASVVGFGAIGKEIGERLAGIGMRVQYTKPTPLTAKEVSQLTYPVRYYETVQEMLPTTDLLVLACPLTKATRHLLNSATLALLPREAKVVNIGRGPLIDTGALISALKKGYLSGAALDVFEKEPVPEEELCGRWDVILTPHIGSSTIETVLGAEGICIANMENVLLGNGQCVTKVN